MKGKMPALGGKSRTDEDAGAVLTEAQRREVLRARAKALAEEPAREETPSERLEVVEFLLSGERYGIESSLAGEVYPLKDMTALPCTPPFVLGIMNVRGKILSILDIRKLFGMPERGLSDLNKVIILHNGSMEFGVLADTILGVSSVALSDLSPSLPTLTEIRADYLKGVTRERLIVLDGHKLLNDPRVVVHEEV